MPTDGSVRGVTQRVILRRNAATLEKTLDQGHFLAHSEQQERLWRISIRASALSDVDYGRFVETLRQTIDPVVASLDDVDVTYTGVIPLIYKAQRELLNDLVESFLLAFGVIALVMVMVLYDPAPGSAGHGSQHPSGGGDLRLDGLVEYLDRDWLDHDGQRGHGDCRRRHVSPAHLASPGAAAGIASCGSDAECASSLRGSHDSHDADLFVCAAGLLAQFLHADPALCLADGVLVDRRAGWAT